MEGIPRRLGPATDARLPIWEALHQLIRALQHGWRQRRGRVLKGVEAKAEAARQLAYRLYTLCERAGRAEDARAYNEVVTGWSGIETPPRKSRRRRKARSSTRSNPMKPGAKSRFPMPTC